MEKKLDLDFSIPQYLENSINILCETINKKHTLVSEKDTVSEDINTAEVTGEITAIQSDLLRDYYISGEMFEEISLPKEVQDDIQEVIYLKYIAEKNGQKIGDVVNYKNQLMMFLSSIKIALINREISQDTFRQLKEKYLVM